MTWLLLAVGLPAVALLFPLRKIAGRGAANAVLDLGLALGLGMGLSAAAYWIWRIVALPEWTFRLADSALWGMVAIAGLWLRASVPAAAARPRASSEWWLAAMTAAVLCTALIFFVVHTQRIPHGDWDAWAIWNLKARFMARGQAYWTDVLSTSLTHFGYPLLLPSSVARIWSWMGDEPPLAGAAVAGVFVVASPIVVAGALARMRGWTPALWGGLLVIAAWPQAVYGSFQFADVPLGFFVLATVVLIALDTTSHGDRRFAALAGLSMGLACLVKNEGLPFMLGLTMAYVGYQAALRRAPFLDRAARVGGFLIAAVPFWMLLYWMKTSAPSTGLASAFTDAEALSKLTDLGRHTQILRAFLSTTWGWSGLWFAGAPPILALALCLGGWQLDRRHRAAAGFAAVALVTMLVSYYAAYVVSPYELTWHLSTSLHRILVHIWPTFVWLFCLVVSFDPDRHRETAAGPPAYEQRSPLATPP
jgi:hypothetical protein